MKPIDYGIFNYHAETFPPELRESTHSVPNKMWRALEEARLVLAKFDAHREGTLSDKRLSPTGKRDAMTDWAQKELPALRARIEQVGQEASATEANLINSIMKDVVETPTEVADVALAQEIRAHFRSMPSDTARSDALRRLASDRTVLRAVLTAPAFLTGVSDDQLEQVRLDAARAADPDRYGKAELMRRGWAATEKAVAAAVRAVQEALAEPVQAQARQPLPEPDPENAARVMEALRKSPNAEQLGLA